MEDKSSSLSNDKGVARRRQRSTNTHNESDEEDSDYNSDNPDNSDDDRKPKAKRDVGKLANQDMNSGHGMWEGEPSDLSSNDDEHDLNHDCRKLDQAPRKVIADVGASVWMPWMPNVAPTRIKKLQPARGTERFPFIVTTHSQRLRDLSLAYVCTIPFFTTIHNAVECDEFIMFGGNIPLTTLNKMYVRESYRMIASSILPDINKAIIIGTPGIGKSLFLIYLLWKLVKERKRILFIYHSYNIYYDGEGGVFSLPSHDLPSDANDLFWNETLWCLFNAEEKDRIRFGQCPYPFCTFVVSISPGGNMLKEFRKPPVPRVFYMPLWTDAEMTKIASSLFPWRQDWRYRFKILGGIPRDVLEETSQRPRKILEHASTISLSSRGLYETNWIVLNNI